MDRATTREMVEDIARTLSGKLRLRYAWEGDRMTFRRTGVKGHIELNDGEVAVYIQPGPLLPVSDRWIRQQVEATMDQYIK